MPPLAALLAQAEPDPRAVEQAAQEAFDKLSRTDMRSGVANIIRRLAQLTDIQPIDRKGWAVLAQAASLLDRADLSPRDVRALDEQLKAVGLNVDARSASPDISRPPSRSVPSRSRLSQKRI